MITQLRQRIAQDDATTSSIVIGLTLAVAAIVIGLLLALLGPIYTTVGLVAMAGGIWIISGIERALWSVVGIITLLPFATLPIKIVLTPTFLDMAMGVVIALYLLQWMTGERRTLTTTPVHALLVLFMILAVFSFVAGLRYAGPTSRALRSFAELLMSIAFAMIIVDLLATEDKLKQSVLVVLIGGTAASVIGIGLWLLPDLVAERILIRLGIIGYPTADVIRYIEQNPELPERAISTSVNPNALGGMLVMVGGLAAPQLITKQPLIDKRWLIVVGSAAILGCLILTFSRGSMLAFGVAVIFIAMMKYRRLLIMLAAFALVLIILPWSQAYIERFVAGLQGADLATQMRFGEYRDALTLIGRYPALGVGFTGSPDIDIYLGVASVYLTMAGNMGIIGVAVFVLLILRLFLYAFQAYGNLDRIPGLQAIWLGLMAAIIGALVNGIFDHYFFNLEFHSAVTIFWIFFGLLMATTRIALDAESKVVLGPT